MNIYSKFTNTLAEIKIFIRNNKAQAVVGSVIILLLVSGGTVYYLESTQTVSPTGSYASEGDGKSCDYNGQVHKDGSGFVAMDGCNSCYCTDGQVICPTRVVCNDNPKRSPPSKEERPEGSDGAKTLPIKLECEYNNTTYSNGSSFDSVDGCNTCMCYRGGVSCTEKVCSESPIEEPISVDETPTVPPIPSNEPYIQGSVAPTYCTYNSKMYNESTRFEALDGCNTCVCSSGKVSCTEMACEDYEWVAIDLTEDQEGVVEVLPIDRVASEGDNELVVEYKSGRCEYDGQAYEDGESYDAIDGCNTCMCVGSQTICSTAKCVVQESEMPSSVWDRFVEWFVNLWI